MEILQSSVNDAIAPFTCHVNYYISKCYMNCVFVDSGTQKVKGRFLCMLLWFTVQPRSTKPHPHPQGGNQKRLMGMSIQKAGLLPGGSEILRLFISS